MTALQLSHVKVQFGGLVAVQDLSFSVEQGTIHSLIGPNGAGKSTVLNTVTGLYSPSEGEVLIQGKNVVRKRPDQISRLGVARSFQNTQLFGEMTVLENVMIGSPTTTELGILQAAFRSPKFLLGEQRAKTRALELIEMVGLTSVSGVNAAALPFAKQRQLELARALASGPKLLLLDEPAAGLRSAEIEFLNHTLLNLRVQTGVTILLVDHVMKVVMSISDRITVLNFGEKIAEGNPAEVRAHPEVKLAYLGSKMNRAQTDRH